MSSSLRATTANWAFPSLSLFSLDRILIEQFAHLLSLYAIFNFVNRPFSKPQWVSIWASLYSYFEKGCGKKNVRVTIPERQYGIWWIHCSWHCHLSSLLLLLSFSTRKHASMASRAVLSNFFEKRWSQNHPQYLSELARARFPTFLAMAV